MEPDGALPPWMSASQAALRAYAEVLATSGVERGLIGPREVPRLWQRHLLNCAVVADPSLSLVGTGARIADIGSGAGLPGVVWAIVRPDVRVWVIEALLRRATFLTEVVSSLGLADRIEVVRARAEDLARDGSWRPVDVVTARAVAPLPTLLRWMVPLMGRDGVALALKGARAAEEVAAVQSTGGAGVELGPQGAGPLDLSELSLEITSAGVGVLDPPTTVVVARRRRAE